MEKGKTEGILPMPTVRKDSPPESGKEKTRDEMETAPRVEKT